MSTTTNKLADKLHDLGERLAKKAAARNPGKENTNKQRSQASQARYDKHNLEAASQAAFALSEGYERGDLPDDLTCYVTMTAIEQATRVKMQRVAQGYHDLVYPDHGNYSDNSPEAKALRAYCKLEATEETKQESELQQILDGLRSGGIDGFFPTPDPVITRMLIGLPSLSGFDVLEPSAGIGSICDVARSMGGDVLAIERHYELCKVLKLKGHSVVQGDFLSYKPVRMFDLVLMNPPFENDQAPRHIQHAFQFLKPGGQLRATMPGVAPKYGDSRRKVRQEFADWVAVVDARYEWLPNDSFKSAFRSTGVSTVILFAENR